MMRRLSYSAFGFAIVALVGVTYAGVRAADKADPAIKIGEHDLGGTVAGPKGPEAGVWVIAETTDLPAKYAKVVVTDDRGRFVIPDLPQANYSVWARGYGLVDSEKQKTAPGKLIGIAAVPAPTEAAAAEYYPGMYWYSMLRIPAASEFPGTGLTGNGFSTLMRSQHSWIDTVKQSCQSCHALGSKGIRTIPQALKQGDDSVTAWARRTQAGQAMTNMQTVLGRIGSDRALAMFADWTDRIEKGELPFAKPERPKGVERNAVITMWDWGTPKHYQHDAASTDKRNPTVNANGPIYGTPEESTDEIPVLDPIANKASIIVEPFRDPATPSSLDLPHGESAYWGDEAIWDGHTSIHNVMLDEKGRVWFSARIRPAANPDFCKKGSDHPSAKVFPLNESVRHLSMYDPKTAKWTTINTCFTTHHLYFGHDANRTLWLSQGGPQSGVVGWFNTKMFEETGDEIKSQGWTPIIIDVNGNGKRDEYVEPNQPTDPAKDKRVMAAFYGIQPSPVDDTVWGQTMDVGFSGADQPGWLIHLIPGPNPSETALAEIFLPPEGSFGPRGIDVDLKGVVWTALGSGHLASFDRKKCKGKLSGPDAATGKVCPEGWTLYKFPGPQFRDVKDDGSANYAYYVWVDRYNTLGLGANVPIAETNGGESLLALVDGKFVDIRIPYPLGFFSKNVDGRIDDPKTGWKGRAVWTTSGTRTVFHGEGGTSAQPKVFKVQIRPDPLAR
jgi:hypothetical protein